MSHVLGFKTETSDGDTVNVGYDENENVFVFEHQSALAPTRHGGLAVENPSGEKTTELFETGGLSTEGSVESTETGAHLRLTASTGETSELLAGEDGGFRSTLNPAQTDLWESRDEQGGTLAERTLDLRRPGAPVGMVDGSAGSSSYTYAVVACTSDGRCTRPGPETTVDGAPSSLTSSDSITLTWAGVGASSYQVLKKENGSWKALGTTQTTSFTDSGQGLSSYTTTGLNETYRHTIYGLLDVGGEALRSGDDGSLWVGEGHGVTTLRSDEVRLKSGAVRTTSPMTVGQPEVDPSFALYPDQHRMSVGPAASSFSGATLQARAVTGQSAPILRLEDSTGDSVFEVDTSGAIVTSAPTPIAEFDSVQDHDVNKDTWTPLPLGSALTTDSAYGYDLSTNPHTITFEEDGQYRLYVNVATYHTSSSRTNYAVSFAVNGTRIGGQAQSSYARDMEGDEEGSSSLSRVIDANAGDTVEVWTKKKASDGNAYVDGSATIFRIERVAEYNRQLTDADSLRGYTPSDFIVVDEITSSGYVRSDTDGTLSVHDNFDVDEKNNLRVGGTEANAPGLRLGRGDQPVRIDRLDGGGARIQPSTAGGRAELKSGQGDAFVRAHWDRAEVRAKSAINFGPHGGQDPTAQIHPAESAFLIRARSHQSSGYYSDGRPALSIEDDAGSEGFAQEFTVSRVASSPGLSVTGVPGSTNYTYAVVARDDEGRRTGLSPSSTTTGPDTLTSSEYVTVSWQGVPSASDYAVLRDDGGSWKKVGVTSSTSFDDTGGGLSSFALPNGNETANARTKGWTRQRQVIAQNRPTGDYSGTGQREDLLRLAGPSGQIGRLFWDEYNALRLINGSGDVTLDPSGEVKILSALGSGPATITGSPATLTLDSDSLTANWTLTDLAGGSLSISRSTGPEVQIGTQGGVSLKSNGAGLTLNSADGTASRTMSLSNAGRLRSGSDTLAYVSEVEAVDNDLVHEAGDQMTGRLDLQDNYLEFDDGRLQGNGQGALEVLSADGSSHGELIVDVLTTKGAINEKSTTSLAVEDQYVRLAQGQAGSPSLDAGLQVERGDAPNAFWMWSESADRFGRRLGAGGSFQGVVLEDDGTYDISISGDADTLDGHHQDAFARLSQNETVDGRWTFTATADQVDPIIDVTDAGGNSRYRFAPQETRLTLEANHAGSAGTDTPTIGFIQDAGATTAEVGLAASSGLLFSTGGPQVLFKPGGVKTLSVSSSGVLAEGVSSFKAQSGQSGPLAEFKQSSGTTVAVVKKNGELDLRDGNGNTRVRANAGGGLEVGKGLSHTTDKLKLFEGSTSGLNLGTVSDGGALDYGPQATTQAAQLELRAAGRHDFTFKAGDLAFKQAGKGAVFTSPDGTTTKRLTANNAGEIALGWADLPIARADVSKADVGLGSVEDIALSSATWADMGFAKSDVSKSDVGLGSVENIALSQATWPDMGISRTDVSKSDVGLGSVPNTDATNASNITAGTLPDAQLPTTQSAKTFDGQTESGSYKTGNYEVEHNSNADSLDFRYLG